MRPVDLAVSYYMHTSSSCYKKRLKNKQDKATMKKKSIFEKSVFKRNKRRKETVHNEVHSFISGHVLDPN